ncbi:DUF2946 family protein [Paracoccus xiamenensis]|uniref:DUF2946 family protein n=1 Tax=Paracoccus xiamenensis TaxID=2714901 RepID=UPI00140AC922|nr:DUF2946 family protein [Paracoccus xiamenensis]NHF73342.1 hypothetical protein [Paracoccus xiamenensis]
MKRKTAELLRITAFCAVLLPFLLSSLIASGFMPTRSADGAITLVICTGGGPAEILVDPVTMQPVDPAGKDPHDEHKPTCAWAASQAAFDAPLLPVLARPLRRSYALNAPFTATTLIGARGTGLPPATGPPLSA